MPMTEHSEQIKGGLTVKGSLWRVHALKIFLEILAGEV